MIKITGNKRIFRGKSLVGVPKTRVSEARQAQKQSLMLKRVKAEPIASTVLKSGLKGVRLMRLSSIAKNHKLLLAQLNNPVEKNWFMKFLDRARDVLYDPNNEIMVDLKIRLNYNYLSTVRIEDLYDDKH